MQRTREEQTDTEQSVELRCKIDRAFGISRSVGKAWFDAARNGDLRSMKGLVDAVQGSPDGAWRLVHYNGQGTSYGFVGSIALHWACALGDVAMAEFLLDLGSSVNCQNYGGSSPLHSAVANCQLKTTLLLLSRGANISIVDCCGDTPLNITEQHALSDAKSSAVQRAEVRRALLAYQLSLDMSEIPEAQWKNEQIRALLEAESHVTKQAPPVERAACVAQCRKVIASIRHALEATIHVDSKAREFLTTIRSREVERQRMLAQQQEQDGSGDDDDDRVAFSEQVKRAEELKQKGNDLFRQGDMKEAIKCYTAAIALNANEATFYSNRSACYLALGNGVLAAQDARVGIELRPTWAKCHYRLGCAMSLLGRWDSAVLCFEQCLQLEPDDASAAAGLAAARAECEKDKVVAGTVARGAKRPWFDCPLCENRTRDSMTTPCCAKQLCGTCWIRRGPTGCPFCAAV